jgi:hypothetical protein
VTNKVRGFGISQGGAKAWINFNGTGTPAITDSYNISSITDNGLGDYTINFTTAFANANYVMVGGQKAGGAANIGFVAENLDTVTHTASAHRIYTVDHTNNLIDSTINNAVWYGDQ